MSATSTARTMVDDGRRMGWYFDSERRQHGMRSFVVTRRRAAPSTSSMGCSKLALLNCGLRRFGEPWVTSLVQRAAVVVGRKKSAGVLSSLAGGGFGGGQR